MAAQERRYGVALTDGTAAMTGLEVMRAVLDGTLPQAPISATLGFHLVEVAPGFAAFEGEPSAALLNPMGTVHGGWALTLVDSATGCAVLTTLPAGVGHASIETKANFTRPILPSTGRVRCEGRVVVQGRRVVTAEARVLSADGRVLAHGTSTVMVLAPG